MSETAVTITVQLPVKLDSFRTTALHNAMVDGRMEEMRITEHLKNVSDSLKTQIKEQQKKQTDAARALSAGFEYKPVSCEHRVELEQNKMVTVRLDTGEAFDERALTADEIKHYSGKKGKV